MNALYINLKRNIYNLNKELVPGRFKKEYNHLKLFGLKRVARSQFSSRVMILYGYNRRDIYLSLVVPFLVSSVARAMVRGTDVA